MHPGLTAEETLTKRLSISARQIEAICKGAAKAGFVAELIIGDAVVRLSPKQSEPASGYDENNPATFETLEQYRVWRERKRLEENDIRL